jgi:hypothetical protein
MNWRELYKKIDNLNEPFDLKKKFPGYFNKWYFRGAFIVMSIFFLMLLFTSGTGSNIYIPCPEDSPLTCINPFVYCPDHPFESKCLGFDKLTCTGKNCNSSYIMQGDYVGKEVPSAVKNFPFLCIVILGFAFILNDLDYRRKKK